MKEMLSLKAFSKRVALVLCVMCWCSAMAWAQKDISGTVIDAIGEPVIGANVMIQGTTRGVTTDLDGNFSLSGVAEDAVLRITFIGYTSQEVAVKGQTHINVTLQEENDLLDEVVVVGYGVQKKRDLTGAITSIKKDDITLAPTTNPMESLQGKVAGLDITKSSGQAGSGVTMQLRGNRSFNADGNPLFIIDGLPGDYATLNPNDIESIEVLKDASSTAIYGSAGANGVVIITTKSGQEGKTNVSFNAYLGVNGWATTPKMMNSTQYVDAMRTAYQNAGTYVSDEAMFGYSRSAEYQAYLNGNSIDWADELLQTGITQNYSLSVSGGTERTKGYLSMNFSDEKGQYRNDDYKVYSTNSRLDFKVNKMVSMGTNIQASYVHQNKPFAKLGDVVSKSPLGSTTDEDGNYVTYINQYYTDADGKVVEKKDYINPLINNKHNYRNLQQNLKLYINPYIRITPMKGLTWESRLNTTLTYSKSGSFTGIGSYNYYEKGAKWQQHTSATAANSRSYNYKWENILTWNHTFNKHHDLTLTGVESWYHGRSESSSESGTGISNNAFLWHNLGSAMSKTVSSGYSMTKQMAFIARANYSYKGRYLFSASMRWDGDSRLSEDRRWASFPAASAGWRISDEDFMEPTQDWLDNLKIRVSYGETGNANIKAYGSQSTFTQSFYTLGGEYTPVYGYDKTLANSKLSWERSRGSDIGLDMSFLNNRITLTTDYYLTNTSGVIWTKKLPVTIGAQNYSTQFETNVNLAKTRNQGIEVGLTTRNIDANGFTWNSSLTYSYNKEEITKLMSTGNDIVINGATAYKVGHPVNSYYNYKLNGVWQENEGDEAAIFKQKAGDVKVAIPGLSRHIDSDGSVYYLSKEGTRYDAANPRAISTSDYQILGHNSPDWTLGFKNDFAYKGFDLSIYMFMRWGQMINYNMLTNYDPTVSKRNFAASYLDHIGSYFPLLNANRTDSSITGFSGLSYVDGSFFKIKNITLGYNLPKSLLKKAFIEKCRIYTTITNPLVVAKSDLLEDYDPEMNGGSDYPLTKQLVFGVNLSF